MTEPTRWSGFIAKRAKPKARPRVVKTGHSYMPKDYMTWRKEFAEAWRELNPPTFAGPVEIVVGFLTEGTSIDIASLAGVKRPKHVRADLDNLIGAVMEVAEDMGVVTNDRNFVSIRAYGYVSEGKDEGDG